MAINKKLIHFKTRENFDARLKAKEIPETSIVFIQNTHEIWTHGEFYPCSYTKEELDEKFASLPIIKGLEEYSAIVGDLDDNLASGLYSFAEGKLTNALGSGSHSEGLGSVAEGDFSHAEGENSLAAGECSHAEGSGTYAEGDCSHTEGLSTGANNEAEHASGQYNISAKNSNSFGDSGNTLFSVGNGGNNSLRHNAFEIKQSGDIYIPNTESEGEYYEKTMLRLPPFGIEQLNIIFPSSIGLNPSIKEEDICIDSIPVSIFTEGIDSDTYYEVELNGIRKQVLGYWSRINSILTDSEDLTTSNNLEGGTFKITTQTLFGVGSGGSGTTTTLIWDPKVYGDSITTFKVSKIAVKKLDLKYLDVSEVARAKLADIASIASETTKLSTARTLWGQSFDGSKNITGDLTSVGNVVPQSNWIYNLGSQSKRFGTLYLNNHFLLFNDYNGSGSADRDSGHPGVTIGAGNGNWPVGISMIGKVDGVAAEPAITFKNMDTDVSAGNWNATIYHRTANGSNIVANTKTVLEFGQAETLYKTRMQNTVTGVEPITVKSTTVCPNLNADMVDGYNAMGPSGKLLKKCGAVSANGAKCDSYWVKVASLEYSWNEVSLKEATIYMHNVFYGIKGIVHFGVRSKVTELGNPTGLTEAFLQVIAGNIPAESLKLYYTKMANDGKAHVAELWVDLKQEWGFYSTLALSNTTWGSLEDACDVILNNLMLINGYIPVINAGVDSIQATYDTLNNPVAALNGYTVKCMLLSLYKGLATKDANTLYFITEQALVTGPIESLENPEPMMIMSVPGDNIGETSEFVPSHDGIGDAPQLLDEHYISNPIEEEEL